MFLHASIHLLLSVLLLLYNSSCSHGESSWFHDMWLPSHGVLYGLEVIKDTFYGKCTLVIGDSLARRLTGTIYAIMTHPFHEGSNSELELHDQEIDRYIWHGGHSAYTYYFKHSNHARAGDTCLKFIWAPLLSDINDQHMHSMNFTHCIVSLGIHDMEEFRLDVNRIRQQLNDTWDVLLRPSDLCVLWRSTPYAYMTTNDTRRQSFFEAVDRNVDAFNVEARNMFNAKRAMLEYNNTMYHTDHCLPSFIEYEQSIHSRELGDARLSGDTPEHLSNLARVVLLQEVVYTLLNGSLPNIH